MCLKTTQACRTTRQQAVNATSSFPPSPTLISMSLSTPFRFLSLQVRERERNVNTTPSPLPRPHSAPPPQPLFSFALVEALTDVSFTRQAIADTLFSVSAQAEEARPRRSVKKRPGIPVSALPDSLFKPISVSVSPPFTAETSCARATHGPRAACRVSVVPYRHRGCKPRRTVALRP